MQCDKDYIMCLQGADFTEDEVLVLPNPEGIFFTNFNLCHKQ